MDIFASHNSESRFICDDNLGKLARYLRIAGYDTLFYVPIEDGRLLQIALDEHRHLLTRDRRLAERTLARDIFLITSDHWPMQLKAVIDHFSLSFDLKRLLTRCLEDNALTVAIDKKTVESLLFPYTFSHFQGFRQCPQCRRVYWAGSHIEAMMSRLKRLGFIAGDLSGDGKTSEP